MDPLTILVIERPSFIIPSTIKQQIKNVVIARETSQLTILGQKGYAPTPSYLINFVGIHPLLSIIRLGLLPYMPINEDYIYITRVQDYGIPKNIYMNSFNYW